MASGRPHHPNDPSVMASLSQAAWMRRFVTMKPCE